MPASRGAARRAEHWTVATDTARYAGTALGRHLSGGDPAAGGPFIAVPTFWSDQYEMRIQSFGVTGLDDVRVLEGDLELVVLTGDFTELAVIVIVAHVVAAGRGGDRGEVGAATRRPHPLNRRPGNGTGGCHFLPSSFTRMFR